MSKKRIVLLAGCVLTCAMLGGCGEKKKAAEEDMPVVVGTYEAEDAVFNGNVSAGSSIEGFSGTGYAEGFEADGDSCTFKISIEEAGFYDLQFTAAAIGGYKENYVLVDGASMGTLANEETAFTDGMMERVYLEAGEHEVTVSKYWGYIALDRLTVLTSPALPEDYYTVSAKLSNPNASDNAKRLMSYLADNYGTNIISGQYCDQGLYGQENAVIWKTTGKFPAMVGLDILEATPSRVANGSQDRSIEYAQEAWEAGAIVTMCWHWNAPSEYLTGTWYSGFYKEHTNINLDKIMNGEDPAGYDLLLEDMDVIAKELQKLRDAGVPILWRPLHEASGGWFWWGNCEAESYIALYRLMYDKFTNEYGLDNLIWVWNGQDKAWYPGDDVVDIVGEDIYPGEHVYSSQIDKYMEVHGYPDSNKMIVLSENGCMFDPDLAIRDGAMWGYFGTWGGSFITNSGALNVYSEQYTEETILVKIYNHENVITLDELPDLTTYPIREDAQ